MGRDLALAGLVGPGLVVGLAAVLDLAGVIAIDGLTQRVVTVLAVALALAVFVLRHGPPGGGPGRGGAG